MHCNDLLWKNCTYSETADDTRKARWSTCCILKLPLAPTAWHFVEMKTMRDIAKSLNVSVSTVSRALNDNPSVNPQTRAKVLKLAKKEGYFVNAHVAGVMSSVRQQRSQAYRGNIAVIWCGAIPTSESEERLQLIFKGVENAVLRLGFSTSHFSLTNATPASLLRVIHNRGIKGVLVAAPAFTQATAELKMNLSNLCVACLGSGLALPELHNVRFDYFNSVRMALMKAQKRFGNGIAAVWDLQKDRRVHRVAEAAFTLHHPGGVAWAQRLFLGAEALANSSTRTLFKELNVQCLLLDNGVGTLPSWLESSIPTENRILWCQPDRQRCFGWIDTQNEILGRWSVELLAAKLNDWNYGIPETRQLTLVPPVWRDGHLVSG